MKDVVKPIVVFDDLVICQSRTNLDTVAELDYVCLTRNLCLDDMHFNLSRQLFAVVKTLIEKRRIFATRRPSAVYFANVVTCSLLKINVGSPCCLHQSVKNLG